MPAHKGHIKEGGRVKGTPNITTSEAKKILEQALYNQLGNINSALTDLYSQKDKAKYIDAISKLFVYVLPKKADIGGDIRGELTIIRKVIND